MPRSADVGYVQQPSQLIGGNRIELIPPRDLLASLLAAIGRARRFLHLEFYIFQSDDTGQRVAGALADAVDRGIEVRLIYDAVGVLGQSDAVLRELAAAGAEVAAYHPLLPWRRGWGKSRFSRRDHRKLMVVDGCEGFTGGANIGDEYVGTAGAPAWHDLFVRVEGPAVRELGKLFLRTWNRHGTGRLRPNAYLPHPEPAGEASLAVLGNDRIGQRRSMRNAYRHAIKRAGREVWVANAYFLPDRAIRRALRLAAARGVAVHLVLPAHSDVPVVQAASQRLWGRYLRWGIALHLWPASMMHAKAGSVDGQWGIVGSFNFDHRSMFANLEVAVAAADAPFAASLTAELRELANGCIELEPAEWRRRPWWRKAWELFCFQFRLLM